MKYFVVSFVFLAIFSCSPRLSPDSSWAGKRWVLTEMKEVPVQLSGGRRDAYVQFDAYEKRFSGYGGCNQMSGTYSIEKTRIRFGEITSTRMSCNDIEFENTFFSTLNDVDRFEQRGNDLLLKRKRNVLLRLTAR